MLASVKTPAWLLHRFIRDHGLTWQDAIHPTARLTTNHVIQRGGCRGRVLAAIWIIAAVGTRFPPKPARLHPLIDEATISAGSDRRPGVVEGCGMSGHISGDPL